MCSKSTVKESISSKVFYEKNTDFKNYVDKCVSTYNKTLDEVFQSPITEAYKLSLMDGGCNAKNSREEG